MEFSISNYLKNRIQSTNLEAQLKYESKEYSKKWAEAVQHFQRRINQDRKKENQPLLSFIVIRQKLAGIKEIDDLRWFYKQCVDYKYKKKGNTFSKCFWGALK
jgi:hypothetical protein